MKVLVAGATGAIGRPLVSALLAQGARSDRDEQLRKWSSKPARKGRGGRSGERLG